MTSRPTEGGKPPLLSREMRLVLALLLLLALLGGWFVWTSNRDAAALADAPVPAPSGDPPAGSEEDAGAAAVTPAPGTTPQETAQEAAQEAETAQETAPASEAAVPVEPGAEIEVPQIPAFGEAGEAPGEAAAEAVPTPGGINPDVPLAALPGRNPFRPLELEASGSSEAPASPVAAAPATSAADGPFVPAGSGTPSGSTSGGSGALALSPLPGTPGSRPSAPAPAASTSPSTGTSTPSGSSGRQPSAGAFPTPRLPGTGSVSVTLPAPTPRASAPAAAPSAGRTAPSRTAPPRTTPTRTTPTRTTPTRTAPAATTATPRTTPRATPPANRPSTSTPNAARPSAAAGAPAMTGTVPPAPRPAPVAGVSVPRDPISLGTAAGTPAAGSLAAGSLAAGSLAASTSPAPATVPNVPQPVTQFGLEGSAASPDSPLGTLIQTRDLHFDAAVLGPVNTAIFRSKDGYVVVSQGQTLPDSDVVVREVRTSGVTLELGGETLDLGEEAGARDAQPTGLTDSLPVVIVSQPAEAFAAWGDLAFIAEFDPAQTDSPADPRLALALAAPIPDLSRDQGEP